MKRILLYLPFLLLLSSLHPKPGGRLQLFIHHQVGGQPLLLDSGRYTNALGQEFRVGMFKYYISHVSLQKGDGSWYEDRNDYFLVNEDEPASKTITLNDIPEGQYSALRFMLGVDSLHNCSGIQEGTLDPVKGMFWTWNTGYIFLKLEGTCPGSTSPGHIFEYHIGGYKPPNNCIRTITLPLPTQTISGGFIPGIQLRADVLSILQTPNSIDFSKLSSVTDFHHATTLADNISTMFSITK